MELELVKYKTIKIKEELYDRLGNHIDRYGETMSDIVEKILDSYEGKKK